MAAGQWAPTDHLPTLLPLQGIPEEVGHLHVQKNLATSTVDNGLEQTWEVSGCQASWDAERTCQVKADEGPKLTKEAQQ